jgi:Uma2 family endonuclease
VSLLTEAGAGVWTAVDLAERFGAIPLHRVRTNPAPGTATEQDVIDTHDREDRLCELIDGTLLEKTVATFESWLAGRLFRWIADYADEKGLGLALPPDGMMRMAHGLVRIPDVSFISWQRLPERELPHGEIWSITPDLAVEIISKGNTHEEMERKLLDYFEAGIRQVWYVYPELRQVYVYVGRDRFSVLNEQQTLEGGEVLPGFRLELGRLFQKPGS